MQSWDTPVHAHTRVLQDTHRHTGANPAKGHEDDGGIGAPDTQGEAGKLELLHLGKVLISVYKYLLGRSKDDWARLLSNQRIGSKRHELKFKTFHLNTKIKTVSTGKVLERWKRGCEPPPLALFKTTWTQPGPACWRWQFCREQGAGLEHLQSPVSHHLFCDSIPIPMPLHVLGAQSSTHTWAPTDQEGGKDHFVPF